MQHWQQPSIHQQFQFEWMSGSINHNMRPYLIRRLSEIARLVLKKLQMWKWFVGVVIGLVCGVASAGFAQVTATPGEKMSVSVAKLQGHGGQIFFPCGNYDVDGTIDVKADGVYLRGSGYCSRIHITASTDVFNVMGAFFVLEGFEVVIDSAQDRTEANFIRGSASQGRVSHVRFSGSSKIANNGRIFFSNSQAGGLWYFEDIRITGGGFTSAGLTVGPVWRAFIALTSATDKTISGTSVINVVGTPGFTDAAFDFNGAIDTVQLVQLNLGPTKGRVFWLHNSVKSPISPRLVYCQNCSIETRNGSTAIQLDASRVFSFQGGIGGADVMGVYVGPGAIDTNLSNIFFLSLRKGAITIAAGAQNTLIKGNIFEDTTDQATNQYDTITVEPGAANFVIADNLWRSTNRYKARYAINLPSGGASSYRLLNNQISNDVYATGTINNAAKGQSYAVTGNSGVADKSDVK